MAWLEATDPALARDLRALVGIGEFALMFTGAQGTKKGLSSLKTSLKQLKYKVEWYKVVINHQLEKSGQQLNELTQSFTSEGQMILSGVTKDGSGVNYRAVDLDDYAKQNGLTQKSVGGGVSGATKTLTSLSKSFENIANITRTNVSKLLELSEKTVKNPTVNGHTKLKHVAKSDEFLIDRVQENIRQNKKIPATSFHDLATAEKAIRDVLQTTEGQKLLKNVILKSKNKVAMRFEKTFNLNTDLGYGFEALGGEVQKMKDGLTKIKLVLETDKNGGFQIISSYPVK